MADTTTLAKAFIKPEIGSHPDTWGDVLNGDIDMIDSCVGGVAAFTVGGNFTLSTTQAQNLTYEISGALGADATITFPVFRGMAFVRNLTSGGFQLICQMNTGGRSIPVGPGVDRLIVGDGVDFFSNVLAVAKTGDTMSGPLSIITASGTTGLYVSANATVGGLLSAATIANSGGYYANGSLVLAANTPNGGYNILYDNSGAASIYMGGPATDASNIYRQTQHAFQSRTGVSFAEFNASGVGLHGSTIVYDTMTVNGGGLALNVPAASASIGGNLTVYQQANTNILNVTGTGNSAQFAGNINVSQTTACYGTGTAVYVPNGNIFTNGVLFVDGTGVIYKNVGPQGFNFRWDGTYAYVRIDNAVEYPIASAGSLGNYLPLGGGTITGNLIVNNAFTVGGTGYFGGDVTIHGGGNAALNIDNGGLAVASDLAVGATGYFGGDVTIHGGGNAALNIDNGGLVVAGNGVFGQALTVNSGGAHITGGVFCDGAVINGGLTVNNPFISCQNIDASNDVAAHGVFRRESVALGGPRGARIECYGGDWDFMTFVMNGGYLQISPDGGASGYTLQPVSGFSDARLKENIRDTEIDALEALCDLTLRTFEWNEKATELMPWRSGTVPCGLVAQELQATIPYAVSELPSSDMLHVHNDYLVPYLIRAIQQLTERVEELKQRDMAQPPDQPKGTLSGLVGQLLAYVDRPWKAVAAVVLFIVGGLGWVAYEQRGELVEAWLTPDALTLNTDAVPAALDKLVEETGADLVQVWAVDLSANSQRFIAARRRDGERPVIPEPRRLPVIVRTGDLQVLVDVINGHPSCVDVTPTAPSPVAQRLAQRGMTRGCAIPIPPSPDAFVGVIYITWLKAPDLSAEEVAIGAARQIARTLVNR